LIGTSDQVSHAQFDTLLPAEGAPVRLYCLCKTTDENNMIGCDRCEEWYHFACVGIDQVSLLSSHLTFLKTTITDFDNYEFVCPSCKKRELSKGTSKKASAKKTAVPPPTAPPAASLQNKRSAKANGKQLAGNTLGVVSQASHEMASKNEGGSKIVVNAGSQLINRKVTGPQKAEGTPNQTS
jgi:hypothetical protein